MKKKGNPRKSKKFVRRLQKKPVTRKYGYIPKARHFCIICGTKKKLTVHHDKKQADDGSNHPKNLEILCELHHRQLHHKYFYKGVKRKYAAIRKAKFNKIQTS